MRCWRCAGCVTGVLLVSGTLLRAAAAPATRPAATAVQAVYQLLRQGRGINVEQAAAMEAQLALQPNDVPSRIKLLGHYRMTDGGPDGRARESHIFWLIEHEPSSPALTVPEGTLRRGFAPEPYEKARALWLKQVEAHSNDSAVVGTAGTWLSVSDFDKAEELLKHAAQLDATEPRWLSQLAQLYRLEMISAPKDARPAIAAKALKAKEAALTLMPAAERYYGEDDVARFALEAGDIDKARQHATDLLVLAEKKFPKNWNYGNAIFHGHSILGRIALASGDVEQAKRELLQSAKTPGSPQLNSFGPDFALAQELLNKGERDTVKDFLRRCGKFWKMENGRLQKWIDTIDANQPVDLGARG